MQPFATYWIHWVLLLQEYDMEIRDKRGIENVVADHLSCLKGIKEEQGNISIIETFLDEQLFVENTKLP